MRSDYVTCICAHPCGRIEKICEKVDELYQHVGPDPGFVGTISDKDVVAMASLRQADGPVNPLCDRFSFDAVHSVVIVVQTDKKGDPKNMEDDVLAIFMENAESDSENNFYSSNKQQS
jgi:hypothetical protein